MTAIAPEASKAATLTGDGELTFVSFPISKTEETPDGDLVVYGKATDGSVDSDEQIVDPDWAGKGPGGLQDWLATAGNVRVQHQAQRDPAGKGLSVEVGGEGGHWVKSLVVEPVAKELVRKGVLTAYSVGIARPEIVRDPVARGGRIKGGQIVELSLVDRPANKNCGIELVKAAGDGTPEFTGKVFGAAGMLDKAASTDDGTVNVDLPADVSLSISPADLAKLTTFKQRLVQKGAVPAAPAVVKADLKDSEREGMPASDFAYVDPEGGKHLPVHDEGHVRSALGRFAQQHFDSPAARKKAARKIVSRARGMGMDLGEHGAVVAAAGGKKVARATTSKAAKCACSGGMMDGKPCTMCKAGKRMAKKATEPQAAKGKGKLRALCPGCGAKQNHKHVHCTECGRQLPAMPPMVAKNHDFMCLGCGHDLDKGEKFCPGCGKENPGHNPMADMKIPANEAVKARKDRVAKGKKKGKKAGKGEPFGGAQAKPFGGEDEPGESAEGKKPAAKKAAKTAAKGMKPGKGKKPKAGHKPTPGEAGGVPGAHEMPAPPHREPDGAEIENFERDAHLEDGDNEKPTAMEARTLKGDPEAAAAMALKALDVPQHLGALHALTCPAYSPEAVAKAFPHASFAGIDPVEWHAGALEKAASAPLAEAQGALGIYTAAMTLKAADPYALADIRSQAHKAFRDANPGPASFPEPGQISPTRFNRPYISDGHGAASPGYQGPHHAKLPEVGGIVSTDYNRPYLDAGHASESPDNQHTPGPMQPPSSTGVPTHEPAQGFMSSNAIASMQHAMSRMHDHLSRRFPDVCPMEDSMHIGSNPVPVPHGVPQPAKAPGARKAAKAAKKSRKAAKAKARKAAKAMAAKRRKLEAQVLKGKLSVDDARVKMGLKPIAPPENPMATKAAAPVAAALDPEVLEAAIAKATAKATRPLAAALSKSQKAQRRQGKAFRKLQKTTDAIASQPDTSASPMRMAALTKSTASAAPAVPQTVTGSAEQAQVTKMQLLQNEWRNSPDPSRREAAYAELTQMLGVNSMTPPSPMTIPMRT